MDLPTPSTKRLVISATNYYNSRRCYCPIYLYRERCHHGTIAGLEVHIQIVITCSEKGTKTRLQRDGLSGWSKHLAVSVPLCDITEGCFPELCGLEQAEEVKCGVFLSGEFTDSLETHVVIIRKYY